MNSSPSTQRGSRWLGRTRSERHRRAGSALVAAQFGLVALCLVPVGPVLWAVPAARTAGLVCLGLAALVGVLALVGLGRHTRVHPVPAAEAPLRTGGIYGVIRHPMYAAVLLACLGVTLSAGRLLALLALVALAGVLRVKARFEDQLLAEQFGWQFAVYECRVPALVPQPWRSRRR
jgi:protein-S-isoprenylcysteine O-methyltransferase Ste14